MRCIVAGGRDFDKPDYLDIECSNILANYVNPTILNGKCPTGADKLADQWAKDIGFPIEYYPADWSQGAKSGPLRNQIMASNADMLICFYSKAGSKGTKSMIDLAIKAGLEVHIFRY